MIEYRTYKPKDAAKIPELWNQCLLQDPVTFHRFRNLVLLDVNFDPEGFRIASSGDQLVGCLYAVRRRLPLYQTDLEPENGWISFFFVHPEWRRQGIGTQLMEEGLAFLQNNKRQTVFFSSYAPNYFLPGLDAAAYPEGMEFLQKCGFEIQYSPVAMDRSLVGYHYPTDVLERKSKREEEGYRFGAVEAGDLPALIECATEVFNPDWGRAIREGILQGMPANRVWVVHHEDEIAGFCLYGGYEGIPDRFGPFGIHPKYQGKGLGKILLHEVLSQMRAESLHHAWFLWTGEQTAAGFLYKQTDFRVTRKFHVMKRKLTETKE